MALLRDQELTLPRLTDNVIECLRGRELPKLLDKLPLPTEWPDGWVPVEFVKDDSDLHVVDHDKYDYYRDEIHPWRSMLFVKKGDDFDVGHKCGKWVKVRREKDSNLRND